MQRFNIVTFDENVSIVASAAVSGGHNSWGFYSGTFCWGNVPLKLRKFPPRKWQQRRVLSVSQIV